MVTDQVAELRHGTDAEPLTVDELRIRAEWIRLRVVEMIDRAGLGHYSSVFSCAELLSVLYYRVMRLDAQNPGWAERDRFLLGKGHAAVGLWPILADLGYLQDEDLADFGFVGSRVGDHPDMRLASGIDFSSGSLGHNLSVGLGMAIAGRIKGLDYRTYVVLGDGELHEGQVWEAAMAASFYRASNLVAIVDSNGFIGSGPIEELMSIEPLGDRFAAFGWDVREIDGHDVAALVSLFDELERTPGDKPVCIIARTAKGKGVSFAEAEPRKWHIGWMNPAEKALAVQEISSRM